MARLTHKEPKPNQPSTGVADSVVRIDISQAASSSTEQNGTITVLSAKQTKMRRYTVNVTKRMEWQTASSIHEEIATTLSLIAANRNADQGTFSPPPTSPTAADTKSFPPPAAKIKPRKRTSSLSEFRVAVWKKFRRKKLPKTTPQEELVPVLSRSFLDSSLTEEVMDANPETEVLWTLYMSDVGGQPEFQELIAAVVSGPTVFFVVFPLHLDLDGNFRIEYLDEDGDSMVAYESSLTVREALLQSLASIASTGIIASEDTKILPKVLFVGTHKDKLSPQTQQEDIRRIDRDLQQMIEGTEAIDENMVVFASPSQMIFTVDNTQSSQHPDFDQIRTAIEEIGNEAGSVYKVSIPYTWMTLSVLLRQKVEKDGLQTYSYEQCFRDAQELGIKDQTDFNNALFFLHTNLGVIRHYHDIPELRHRIITDPQHIYNKVTTVIKSTFNLRGKRGMFNDFVRKGIFKKDDLMKLLLTRSEDITPEQLLALLEHLNIIAPFEGKAKYFLPCALQHAPDGHFPHKSRCYDSLLFTFARGYCPKGIFGAAVVEILKSTGDLDYKWQLEKDKIFRNQFSMTVGPHFDSFHFTLLPKYIKIDAYPAKIETRSEDSLSLIFSHVREQVTHALTEVTRKLNYNDGAKHALSFLCPANEGFPHPAQVSFLNGVPCGIHCSVHEHVRHKTVDQNHFLWFHSSLGMLVGCVCMEEGRGRLVGRGGGRAGERGGAEVG